MSADTFGTVRQLIKEQKYDEARALLLSLNSPVAQAWLESLDGLGSGQKVSGSTSFLRWVIIGLIFVAVALGIAVYVSYNNEQQRLSDAARNTLGVIAGPPHLQAECDRRGFTDEECDDWILSQAIEVTVAPANGIGVPGEGIPFPSGSG